MFNFDSHKIIIAHFTTKSEGVNSFFLQISFQNQNVYTRTWIIKRLFVYSIRYYRIKVFKDDERQI